MAIAKKKKPVARTSLSKMPKKFPDIGKRFAFIKELLGITWTEMAKQLRTSRPMLMSIKDGKSIPNFSVLRRMKKVYKIPYDYLIDGEPLKMQDSRTPESLKLSSKLKDLEDTVYQVNKRN